MQLLARAKPYLAAASRGYWVAALAILLTSTSLAGGYTLDDYFHRARAQGLPVAGGTRLDLFAFSSGPEDAARMMELGVLPWFSYPKLLLSFFRPISSLSHLIDYTYFPGSPWLMHAESVLLYGALVFLASALYRRTLAVPWIAGLASVAYAVDDAHALPVGWVANRNAVIAVMFALASLVAHDRHRRDGWRLGAFVGPACLLAGLLSAEAAIGILGYFAAYALFIDRGPWSRRLGALVPHAVLIAAWQVVYRALGHGARGSGFYLDPMLDPVLFATAASKRGVALLLGQFLTPPSDVWVWLPAAHVALLGYAALVLGVIAWVLVPLLKRDPVARFYLCGAILAAVPVCATFPSDRLLLVMGIGAMGLVAQLLGGLVDGAKWRPMARMWTMPARALGWVWLIGHLMIAPVILTVMSLMVTRIPEGLINRSVERLHLGPELGEQTAVIVSTPDLLRVVYGWIVPRGDGHATPKRTRILSSTMKPVRVERPDAFTLVVHPKEGFLADLTAQLVHGRGIPMHLGDKVALSDMTAEVTEMNDHGEPCGASFRFQTPLEDPSRRWFAWDGTRFIELALPPVGGSIVLGTD